MNRLVLFATFILPLGLVLVILLVLPGSVRVTASSPIRTSELRVCPMGCDYSSVQAAVDADCDGDIVKIAQGTYTDVHARPRNDITTTGVVTQVVYISKTVVIQGGYTVTDWTMPFPITQPTILDAQGQGRVIYITGNISPTLEGLDVTGGNGVGLGGGDLWGDSGGGIYIIVATAHLSHNRVFSNTAHWGGGLFLSSSPAMLIANAVFSNVADTGGGLALNASGATLDSNAVFSNIAREGGGVVLYNSAARINRNTITTNAATAGGGLLSSDSEATLTRNIVSANTAQAGGGLWVYTHFWSCTLDGNVIAGNIADVGGGLYFDPWVAKAPSYAPSVTPLTLTNNLIAGNQCNSAGSGVFIYATHLYLLHNTLARNSGGDGSAMSIASSTDMWGTRVYPSQVYLTNTLLVSHTIGISVTEGNILTVNGVLWSGTFITVSQSPSATVTVQNQREGDPAFAADGYHLLPGSAAIDAGVDAGVRSDIDYEPRPYQVPDLGADEYWPPGALKHAYLPIVLRN